LFYAPPESFHDNTVTLPPDEARHAQKVLRLKPGAPVIVVDGQGTACRGSITQLSAKTALVTAHAEIRNFGEPRVRLTLAAGLSVGSKFDTVVQKGTELGVTRFVPVISEKSKVTFEEPGRARARTHRLHRVALAATKQCRRSYCPEITIPMTLEQFLAEHDPDDLSLLFHPSGQVPPFDRADLPENPRRAIVLVGPESGFTAAETEAAHSAGFTAVSLGQRILRAETAGPVAVALLMHRLGEFR